MPLSEQIRSDRPAPADEPSGSRGTGCTVGVLGGGWRASVTPWGAIRPWDGSTALDWHVAADDRWHTPSSETTIRQSRLAGTPVVETRLRVPKGDVVHRVFAVADHGGLTLVEVFNDSPLPVAVAFSGARVLSARPPATVPIEGIDLPEGTAVFPVGHRATIVVALSHDGVDRPLPGGLPGGLPAAEQVAHGWSTLCDRASRLELPDDALVDAVVAARCELLLAGAAAPTDDPVGFLLDAHQLVRLGESAEPWMPDVAQAAAALARPGRGASRRVEQFAALDAATAIAAYAGDGRAQGDLAKMRAHLESGQSDGPVEAWLPAPETVTGSRMVAAVERRLALGGDLLPAGLPASWLGQDFDVHGVPTIGRSTVSYALRWHGDRPAVLWERAGAPVRLTSSVIAPGWSSDAASGEALWPAPAAVTPNLPVDPAEPGSFS